MISLLRKVVYALAGCVIIGLLVVVLGYQPLDQQQCSAPDPDTSIRGCTAMIQVSTLAAFASNPPMRS
jgi:hypothetical protein